MLALIGYFPKKVVHRPDWLKAAGVTAIRSVSTCISKAPEGWIQSWTHNDLFIYSTRAAAAAVVPQAELGQYELHAYRMLPSVFDHGERRAIELPKLGVEPLAPEFQSVGFDAVSRSWASTFDCSPLSCNLMAQEIATNEHCLLSNLAVAEEVAHRFAREEPEPGPYYVLEVLRGP